MNVLHPQDMKNTTLHQTPEQPNKTQQPDHDGTSSGMETCQLRCRGSSPAKEVGADHEVKEEEAMRADESEGDNGREKLKRHRVEVAGNVWIPDIWGQEELLKDWIDCSAFNDSLVPHGIMSARAALVQEGRRANSGGFRIENRIEDAVCEVSQNHGYHQERMWGRNLAQPSNTPDLVQWCKSVGAFLKMTNYELHYFFLYSTCSCFSFLFFFCIGQFVTKIHVRPEQSVSVYLESARWCNRQGGLLVQRAWPK